VGQAPSGHVPSPGARRGVAEGPATGAEQVELPPPPSVQPLPGSVGPGAVPSALKPARAAGAAKSSAAERPAPKRAAPRRSSADAGKRGDWESQLETEWK